MVKITVSTRQGSVVEQIIIESADLETSGERITFWLDLQDDIKRAETMDQIEEAE